MNYRALINQKIMPFLHIFNGEDLHTCGIEGFRGRDFSWLSRSADQKAPLHSLSCEPSVSPSPSSSDHKTIVTMSKNEGPKRKASHQGTSRVGAIQAVQGQGCVVTFPAGHAILLCRNPDGVSQRCFLESKSLLK